MPIIAMSREIGSKGRDVALHVTERLGLTVHPPLASARTPTSPTAADKVHRDRRWRRRPDRYRLMRDYLDAEEVLALALGGDVLIRGWGAARLLRDIPHVLTVRVRSPRDERIGVICRQCGVTEAVARRLIRRWDVAEDRSDRGSFVGFSARPHRYDLTLDAGELSPEACANRIVEAATAAAAAETPETRALLEERMREARLCATVHALRYGLAGLPQRERPMHSPAANGARPGRATRLAVPPSPKTFAGLSSVDPVGPPPPNRPER